MQVFRFGLVGGVIAVAASLAPAATSVVAVSFTTGGSEGSSDETRGFAFYTSGAVTITAVGWYDSGQDGLAVSHQVGIWDSTGTQLVNGVVSAGTTDPLNGLFRYNNGVTGTTTLPAGNYIIGGLSNGSDATYRSINPSFVTYGTGLTFNGSTENLFIGVFSEPTSPTPGFDVGYFGPNFTYTTVPEPVAGGVVCLGSIVAARRRRR